jgi:YegS/Rv2252/BmrU family lipid kinase
MLIVHNPAAGRQHPHPLVERVAAGLSRNGHEVDLAVTLCAGDATRLAAEAVAASYDMVVAAGGDGTVNEVLQALVGTDTALGVLPIGTVNVWAGESGLRGRALRLIELLGAGHSRAIDVGIAGSRYFMLMASIGLDAEVVRTVEPGLKRRLGRWAYAVSLTSVARNYLGTPATLYLDDRHVQTRLLMLVVGNTRRYAGHFQATPRAVADDGQLDVLAIQGERAWRNLPKASALIAPAPILRRHMVVGRARTIRVVTQTPLPVQVDGDFVGRTPLTIRVVPRALRVVVRDGQRGGLFSQQSQSA